MAKTGRIVDTDALEVIHMMVGPFENNIYIVRDRNSGRCLLIDAAAEADAILGAIGDDHLEAVLLTHTHMDHIQALRAILEKKGAPIGVHPQEPEAASLKPGISLADGQRITVGSHELEVLHTPGHTPGSVCFLLRPALCFCGDTVFPGGPGKTSSPEAFLRIVQSLENKIYTLADDVRLLPGHGEGTTVGDSRGEYDAFKSQPREEAPWGDVLWKES